MEIHTNIQAIIGLGNPGAKYQRNRHNIGFVIVDALAAAHNGAWKEQRNMELAAITINEKKVLLIKPQTFMNSSGDVIPYLQKQGITAENILVVHDELELPFGKMQLKVGGSAKGHNGLKSIIAACGPNFARLRFGIGRPEDRDEVPDYVLRNFSEPAFEVQELVDRAVVTLEGLYK